MSACLVYWNQHPLDLVSNLGSILPRFRDIRAFVRWKKNFFSIVHPYSGQNFGCSLWSRSITLGRVCKEIVFEVFQTTWLLCINVMDGWTDDAVAIPHFAWHRAVKKVKNSLCRSIEDFKKVQQLNVCSAEYCDSSTAAGTTKFVCTRLTYSR